VLSGVKTVKLNINLAALLLIGASTLTASLPSSVKALSISNGSFESGVDPNFIAGNPTVGFTDLGVGATNITNWSVTNGSVDYVSDLLWLASDGIRSVDLTGTSASAGTFSTDLTVDLDDVGILKTILFDLATNGNNSQKDLTVSVDGFASTSYSIISTTAGTGDNLCRTFSYSFTPTAAGNSTLTFTSLTPGFAGATLDNVRVEAVPFEFSPLSLIGVGAVLLVRSKISTKKKA
jgi:Protein of unknown function (DUF642)